MKTKTRMTPAVFVSAALISGCAPQQQAAEFSRDLLAQTIAYENQLLKLARETQSHGTEIRQWASNHTVRDHEGQMTAVLAVQAEDVVEQIKPTGLSARDVRDFIAAYQASAESNTILVNAKLRKIDARARNTLKDLRREIKPLASVRAKLEELQRGPSFKDHIATLRPILDELKSKL